ncbi:MAG TPA: DUF992 domain-containing protein [Rhizobiales bacterium]|nr:DUF992 domain-containing protein [Hyphomicrobiales bacterium]
MKTLTIAKTAMAAAAASLLVSSPLAARTGVRIGTLDCDVDGGIGLILTSKKNMRCTLTRISGKQEYYTGTIRKYGLDIGVTGKARMGWVVFAPGKINTGSLRGTYVGASADASAGIGGGANVLVGGFNKTITLQPVSLQAQTGLNVAAGVSSLELR